jgi:hypothetical protein
LLFYVLQVDVEPIGNVNREGRYLHHVAHRLWLLLLLILNIWIDLLGCIEPRHILNGKINK